MNIAFFLTPKHEVVTLKKTFTIGQAMDEMTKDRYTSVPVIDKKGHYVNSLSEGDILWHLKSIKHGSMDELELVSINKVKRHYAVKAVSIEEDIDSLLDLASVQAFVPVVDDANIFIGIIKRSDIIQYGLTRNNEEKVALLA